MGPETSAQIAASRCGKDPPAWQDVQVLRTLGVLEVLVPAPVMGDGDDGAAFRGFILVCMYLS